MSNFSGWDMAKVRQLQAEKKIKGYIAPEKKELTPSGKIVSKYFKHRSKEKDFIAKNLWYWCAEKNLKLYKELCFDKTGQKGYLFDWAIPDIKVAIEYEGLQSKKSGHTTLIGYSKDTRKYNLAMAQGWKVIRLTVLTYKEIIQQLNANYAQATKPGSGIPEENKNHHPR